MTDKKDRHIEAAGKMYRRTQLKLIRGHLTAVYDTLFELRTDARSRKEDRLKGYYDLSRAYAAAAIRTLKLVRKP